MQIRQIRPLRALLMLAAGCVLGFALLTAAFLLPAGPMRDHLWESLWTFKQEGDYPIANRHYAGSTWDNFTDSLLLQEAIFYDASKSPLEKAVYIYRDDCGSVGMLNLAAQLEGQTEKGEPISYARYWHGALVWLRPLLLLLNYEDIRTLICMTQVLLFAAVALLMVSRGQRSLVLPYAAMILTLAPTGTMLSIQYFSLYAIMTLGMAFVLLKGEWLRQGARSFYFFLLLGMLTSYFDLLTYPIVTLGMPLALMLCVNRREAGLPFAVAACASWAVGYLGLWALKWVVGSLLVGENLLSGALEVVAFHTVIGEESRPVTRWQAIAQNVGVVCQPAYALLYGGCLAACALRLRRCRAGLRALAGQSRLLLLLALLPFAWWFVTFHHVSAHNWYTYRALAVTVFAVLAWLSPPCTAAHPQEA